MFNPKSCFDAKLYLSIIRPSDSSAAACDMPTPQTAEINPASLGRASATALVGPGIDLVVAGAREPRDPAETGFGLHLNGWDAAASVVRRKG